MRKVFPLPGCRLGPPRSLSGAMAGTVEAPEFRELQRVRRVWHREDRRGHRQARRRHPQRRANVIRSCRGINTRTIRRALRHQRPQHPAPQPRSFASSAGGSSSGSRRAARAAAGTFRNAPVPRAHRPLQRRSGDLEWVADRVRPELLRRIELEDLMLCTAAVAASGHVQKGPSLAAPIGQLVVDQPLERVLANDRFVLPRSTHRICSDFVNSRQVCIAPWRPKGHREARQWKFRP